MKLFYYSCVMAVFWVTITLRIVWHGVGIWQYSPLLALLFVIGGTLLAIQFHEARNGKKENYVPRGGGSKATSSIILLALVGMTVACALGAASRGGFHTSSHEQAMVHSR